MVAVDSVLAILEELQIVSAEQRSRGGSDLDSVLTRLGEESAWWSLTSLHGQEDGEPCPTLTAYQIRTIHKFADNPRRLKSHLRVGNALLLRQIGKGGMGLVYQGWDLVRQRFVAIKRMRRDGSRVLLRRFRKERKVLQKLRHPRIVRLLEYIKSKRSETLVMQYLRGHTLDREIAVRGRVPWQEVVRWAIDILDALQYVHSHNVIHRDIKPTNLMLHRKGVGPRVAILLDVGLAKSLGPEDTTDSVSLMETQAGQLLGTFLYMPPEQWSGKPVFASDIYGLGATLYHALTGSPPFTGKEPELGSGAQPNYVRMCRAHADLKPPRLRDRCPELPEELDHLIRFMLEKAPDKRATIPMLLVAFRRLLERSLEETPAPLLVSVPTPTAVPVAAPQRQELARKTPTRPTFVPPEEAPLPAEDDPDDSLVKSLGGLAHSFWGYLYQDKDARSSTIFASPGEQLRRNWHRVIRQSSDWLVSLGQPGRYPGRFAVALVLVGVLGYGLYWLMH
jgi:serine/threonine protein kinase